MPDHLGEVSRRQAALRLAGHFQPRPETWSVGFRVARAGSGLFQGQCHHRVSVVVTGTKEVWVVVVVEVGS